MMVKVFMIRMFGLIGKVLVLFLNELSLDRMMILMR